MEKFGIIEKRVESIKETLNIAKIDDAEIDKALEEWVENKLHKKLQEKGWLKNE
ncbi:hypothetical protein [Neobacillus sp. NPDC093127]|uniref:hypothetical protein n=1 Tax=Neobacillus sp. NPDC093127 TaxID=3364296 RepID=UPI0037FDA314